MKLHLYCICSTFLTLNKQRCLMLKRHKWTVAVGTVMLHNIGANIQAKQMSHFLTALPLQRWRGSPSVVCMCASNVLLCIQYI